MRYIILMLACSFCLGQELINSIDVGMTSKEIKAIFPKTKILAVDKQAKLKPHMGALLNDVMIDDLNFNVGFIFGGDGFLKSMLATAETDDGNKSFDQLVSDLRKQCGKEIRKFVSKSREPAVRPVHKHELTYGATWALKTKDIHLSFKIVEGEERGLIILRITAPKILKEKNKPMF